MKPTKLLHVDFLALEGKTSVPLYMAEMPLTRGSSQMWMTVGRPPPLTIIVVYIYMMDHRISDLQISRTIWSGVVAQWVKEGHFSSLWWTHGYQIVFEAYAKDVLHWAGILHAEFEPH